MRITFSLEDAFSIKLWRLEAEAPQIAKKAVYAGAKIAADNIRDHAEKVLSDEATGEMMESFGIASIREDENDCINTSIGFDGYDSKGVPNQLKARAKESGTSKQKKTPFVRPAMKAAKEEIELAMAYVIDTETSKILK